MSTVIRILARFVLAVLPVALPLVALAQQEPIGIVIMHGKGGGPGGLVAELARSLEAKGYRVANLDMPWSGRRHYDVDVAHAEQEVAAALADLRGKGAVRVFISGHSQGGAFAVHLARRLPADGVIAIAPGGDVGTPFYRDKVSASLARARGLVEAGKGGEPAQLEDFEGSRGSYPVQAVPSAYVTWFDPDGAMNLERAAAAANPGLPILWIAPTRDYPALRRANPSYFRSLPANSRNRFVEPNADHRSAPSASLDEIVSWTREVAAK